MQEPDPERRQQLLTFVIVGGGATGVELAGALAEWVQRSLVKDYALDCQHIRIVLVHSGSNLLNGMKPQLQAYAERQLQRLGVNVYLNTRVEQVQSNAVHLQSGAMLKAETIAWVTGVQSTVPPDWSLPTTFRQQVKILPTLQVMGQETVYAIGDIAALEQDQTALPMLAAVAVQQGKTVAQNVLRQARGRSPQPFRYRHRGLMAILGRHAAVVQLGRWIFTGWVAWLLWLTVHLFLLRGHRQRLLTLFNWLVSYGWSERVSPVAMHSVRLRSFNIFSDSLTTSILYRR